MVDEVRTISTDLGLLTPEQLLAKAGHDGKGRRTSLEHLLLHNKGNLVQLEKNTPVKSYLKASREAVKWLLDSARLSISVRKRQCSDFNFILCIFPAYNTTSARIYIFDFVFITSSMMIL